MISNNAEQHCLSSYIIISSFYIYLIFNIFKQTNFVGISSVLFCFISQSVDHKTSNPNH